MTDTSFREFIKDKRVLVTGGTGSIGRVIVKSLLTCEPKVVRVFSRDAAKQAILQAELGHPKNARFILGDIRDMERALTAAEDIDVVFHVAAFKYVPEGEYNPFEVVQTNVIGTQNMISVALKTPSVTHFVMVSTDKAVQPTSTMGASKLLAERLVSAAHYIKGKKQKVFAVVRFGNVLGSSGSVLPIFREQIKHGSIMITHPEMTRFFMTVPDAAHLLFKATTLARGGEVFISKMPAVRIQDLAEACIAKFAASPVSITYGAIRPGEKLHEMLLTSDEARQGLETDSLFIVVPQIEIGDITFADYQYPGAHPLKSQSYSTESAPLLQPSEIQQLLSRVV